MEKSIRDLMIDELHDMLSAEEQMVAALPKMVTAAASADLKKAFSSHLKETRGQVSRLTKAFQLMKVKKKAKLCTAMKGLIQECKEVMKDYAKSAVRDAGLISKAQRIEHYEIAAYGTLRTFANELDLSEVAELLQQTLDEEGHADKTLTSIAKGGLLSTGINHEAKEEGKKKKPTRSKRSLKTK